MKARLLVLLLLAGSPLSAQVTPAPTRSPEAGREAALDRAVAARAASVGTRLQPEAKNKLTAASQRLLAELASAPGADPEAVAQREVRRAFPGTTAAQADLLTFYLLVATVQAMPAPDRSGQARSMPGSTELTSIQLQQKMSARSRAIQMISNLMKKISTTQDGIVQNLK